MKRKGWSITMPRSKISKSHDKYENSGLNYGPQESKGVLLARRRFPGLKPRSSSFVPDCFWAGGPRRRRWGRRWGSPTGRRIWWTSRSSWSAPGVAGSWRTRRSCWSRSRRSKGWCMTRHHSMPDITQEELLNFKKTCEVARFSQTCTSQAIRNQDTSFGN